MSDPRDIKIMAEALKRQIARADSAEAERDRLAGEVASLQNTFDLMWSADQRAIKLWQEATGKDHIWPDKAKTTLWLLERIDAAESELDRLKEALKKIAWMPRVEEPWARNIALKALGEST